MNRSSPKTPDVLVIGGGPAGLAVAIAARQKGLSVVVADGATVPIDKACGEGFLPDGLAALERLGIRIPSGLGRTFCGIRFIADAISAEAVFPGRSLGLAIRRTTLHRLIMERASQLGAELLYGTPVSGIFPEGVCLRDCFVRARWIIGADGCNSSVRRWARIDAGRRPRLRYAFRRHYRIAPWSDHMEVYWGERCQGYATAVSSNEVCVAVASHDPHLRLEDGLQLLPRLSARLRGAQVVSAERGSLTGNRQFSRISRGNIALVGDASGTVDAITGEGMGLAFSQAVALAESLACGDMAHYEAEHRKLARRPLGMARLMLTLDGRPRLQTRTLQVFQKCPEIFQRLIALHVGVLPPTRMVWDGLTLGWRLLTA